MKNQISVLVLLVIVAVAIMTSCLDRQERYHQSTPVYVKIVTAAGMEPDTVPVRSYREGYVYSGYISPERADSLNQDLREKCEAVAVGGDYPSTASVRYAIILR